MDTMQKYQYDEQKDQSAAYNGQIQADFSFQFDKPTEEIRIMKGRTVISDKLAEAFMMPRSGEYMDILKKQAISAMSDEEIKRIIAKEILCGGAQSVEEVVKLKNFMENPELEDEVSGEEEKALVQEMSEEDVADFLKMLNASFRETIAKEELKMKESLTELDKKAIDESYVLTKCPIRPQHDIHILPKNGRLFFCHLVSGRLSPVFVKAKELLYNGEASMVHVYKGCAFVINQKGQVTKRIDVVEEPMELIIRNGWEELP